MYIIIYWSFNKYIKIIKKILVFNSIWEKSVKFYSSNILCFVIFGNYITLLIFILYPVNILNLFPSMLAAKPELNNFILRK